MQSCNFESFPKFISAVFGYWCNSDLPNCKESNLLTIALVRLSLRTTPVSIKLELISIVHHDGIAIMVEK